MSTLNREETKVALRASVQDAVHHFTDLRRAELRDLHQGISDQDLDKLQPLITEYDPVVALAIMASDYSQDATIRRAANSDAAQYLRPKLKSVEMLGDPRLLDSQKEKDALVGSLIGVMEMMAKAKSELS